MEKIFELSELGLKVVFNKFAKQANGAAYVQKGGTVILATATSAKKEDFPGFFPLAVDYREQFSAAGKIPGGYYKREGKFSDKEVLTSRLIDRAIRPLFPATYFDEVQVFTTVYSVDKNYLPDTLALIAASLALVTSNIPFVAPVGAVEVARINGELIFSPTNDQAKASDVKLIVAGTDEGICMLEGCFAGLSEEELLKAMWAAHDIIKKQVAWQLEIARELNVEKAALQDTFDWYGWDKLATEFFTIERLNSVCVEDKHLRSAAVKALRESFVEANKTAIETQDVNLSKLDYVFDNAFKNRITDWCLKEGKRVDGRSFTEVRKIVSEVGLLPFAHGSALFQRGGTQALVSATLGSGQDEQRVEELIGVGVDQRFILHYNFPPFSVGEVKPMRGPGRREVGHGHLAFNSIKHQLPAEDVFPYTIRVVSDILESNGSSSMATVCGSTMALLNAGVPLKKMVSGVAMGLLKSSEGKCQPITDLTGFEDNFGYMDFKVAGTQEGVTAIQLDIKYKGGLLKEVFEQALAQAKDARLLILRKMQEVVSVPAELSALVPQFITIKIDPKKIGAIIGTGGKIIKEIIEKTGTTIDTEDDGTVKIFGGPEANPELAVNWIRTLAGQIERGTIYHGRVRRFADFGIFVELVPGLDGLVHISQIPKRAQRNLNDLFTIGQEILVEVGDYDPESGKISLKLVNPIEIKDEN